MRASKAAVFSLTAALAAIPLRARANGRFPQAQHLVAGPGERDDLVFVRASFGLLLSDDGGQRFRFFCEDAWQFLDGFDPPIAIGSRGNLLVGLHNGLTRSRDGCAPTRDPDLDGQRVADLANDPTGRVVLAAITTSGRPVSRVARSDDGGDHFDVPREGMEDVALSTVEVGSADATRLYASGAMGEGRVPAVWRSDDGGRSWARTAARFDSGAEVFISGVDPARPDVVYARAASSGDAGLGGSTLLRSDDGAQSFREVARTRGPMRGFALRDDGRTVWIGGPVDGLLRSDEGGAFRAVSDTSVECLRWHANTLWACGTFAPGAVMLWRATAEGALTPALRWSQVEGPPARCAPGSPVREVCPLRWQVVRGIIAPAPRDAGIDAGNIAPPTPPTDCGCHTGARSSPWGGLCLIALAAMRARRRQTRIPGAG